MKILLVEDDSITRETIANFLTAHEYQVSLATDGEMALELQEQCEYDLIILDIVLPKLDGISICKQWRHQGCQTPILLITVKNQVTERIIGLEAGADDYVTKPFDLEELLARIHALLRRSKSFIPQEIIWDGIHFDSASGRVYSGNQSIHLTPKEYCLLELFLLNPKRIFSRQAILDRLWDFAEIPGEGTVSTHIKSLRQKLKAVGAEDPIETVYGLGYRLKTLSESEQFSPPTQSNTASVQTHTEENAQIITSKVWEKFQKYYVEETNKLSQITATLSTIQPDIELKNQAEQIAHKLAGSLGSLGFINISEQAKQLEILLQPTVLNPDDIQQARELSTAIQQEVSKVSTVLEPKTQANTEFIAYSPLLLIVDEDLMLAEQIRIEVMSITRQANTNKWTWRVEIATDINVARKMITQTPPDVILLDLNISGRGEDGRNFMQELSTHTPKIPVVAFTAKDTLTDRVDFTRWGGCFFVNKNLPISTVLEAVNTLIQPLFQNYRYRVLILDNKHKFFHQLSNLLTSYKIEVFICTDAQNFLQLLNRNQPNLVILNQQMPGFSSIDLCRVVRTDPQWHNLPVTFISTNSKPEIISQAYAAGADDYFSKSMNKNEIATRIWQRLQKC
ncbi:response regulator [Anabaena lutea]|uniref:Response regulator n=1 Tax=Anabaena lutea FACHB-196 TaxID=2692881 RepID=A0ABR8FLL9_9NOST|nr:response regulator [Anabaena lutea]MBD2571096.1 response regulator [Anabaena lutea FACHB-196]